MASNPGVEVTRAHDEASSALGRRLHERLSHTLRAPRNLIRLELPPQLAKTFNEEAIRSLRPAAVLVPIIKRAMGATVLLAQRSSTLRVHAGQISFPGGSCERDDRDVIHTALREAQEEAGVDPELVEIVGYLDDYPTITGFVVTPVVGLLSPGVTLRPDGTETTGLIEIPLRYLLEPGNYHRSLVDRGGVEVPIHEVTYGAYRVWGATAGMLHNLCEKMH